MRVLWITYDLLPPCAEALGRPLIKGSGWLTALLPHLASVKDFELGVAAGIIGGKPMNLTVAGIHYFTVPFPNNGFGVLRASRGTLRRYQEIIQDFAPDVIHVHGTEWFGGLATINNRAGRPAIIALQGLIDFHRRHFLGQLGFFDVLKSRTLREWVMCSGLWKERLLWNKRAAVEREIVAGHQYFEGRSQWDRAHLRRLNPGADYFFCSHVIREEFYQSEWKLEKANRHTLFAPAGSYPLKGLHVLLKAAAILKREFPDIKVRYPVHTYLPPSGIRALYAALGRGGYANYLAKLIKKLDLQDNVETVVADGRQMAEEMRRAHIFVLPSIIENDSTAMVEAQIVGTPSVVSLCGGIPSLVDEGVTALGFPTGDEGMLAEQIRRIFMDDALAVRLSKAAREVTRPKHMAGPIVARLVKIYETVARGGHPGNLEFPPVC